MAGLLNRILFKTFDRLSRPLLKPVLRYEFNHPQFQTINERPIEYSFAFRCLQIIRPAKVLDVGSGRSAWPHLLSNCGFKVTAIDKIVGYWKNNYFNRHFHIVNEDIACSSLSDKFDCITCLSVLEHIPNHNAAVKGMLDLLKPGGFLIATFPYNQEIYVPNAYDLPDTSYPSNVGYICQIFSSNEMDRWLSDNGGEIVLEEFYEIFNGEFWTTGGGQIENPRKAEKSEPHHLGCFMIKKQTY